MYSELSSGQLTFAGGCCYKQQDVLSLYPTRDTTANAEYADGITSVNSSRHSSNESGPRRLALGLVVRASEPGQISQD